MKRVRKGGRAYEYLAFERYSDSRTFIVEDPEALKLFKRYLRAKQVAKSTVDHYRKLLEKLAKGGDPLAVKASRVLLKEASELRGRIRTYERLS